MKDVKKQRKLGTQVTPPRVSEDSNSRTPSHATERAANRQGKRSSSRTKSRREAKRRRRHRPTTSSGPSIDHLAFPHIFEAVVDLAPPGALAALRLVSRAVKSRVDRRFLHLVFAGDRKTSSGHIWSEDMDSPELVRVIDFHPAGGRLVDHQKQRRKKIINPYPNLKCCRFFGLPSGYEDRARRPAKQSVPTIIVPDVPSHRFINLARHYEFRLSVSKEIICAISRASTSLSWLNLEDLELENSPNLELTICIFDTHRPCEVPYLTLGDFRSMVMNCATCTGEGALEREVFKKVTFVGLEAWKDTIIGPVEPAGPIIREMVEREWSEWNLDNPHHEFHGELEVITMEDWRRRVGEEKYRLVEETYRAHYWWRCTGEIRM